MPVEPSEQQIAVLRAVCDTFVPSIEHTPDPHGFWARSATDMGADQAILQLLGTLPDTQAAGLLLLLDALAGQGFEAASRPSREQLLRTTSLANREAAGGIATLGGLTLLIVYAGADPQTGQNPNWPVFGFPGPVSAAPEEPKRIVPLGIDGDIELEADAVIVGSGAGGGVIAAQLAEAGLRVVVLEAGGYFNEADFNQSELWAYQNLYWRGGPNPTGDMNISLQAGSCLGGGTVVNWTNSLKTKPWVREQWAREFGLEDVGTEEWERHIDAIWERLGVNDDCSDLNVPHQLMQAGADALGWRFVRTTRNTDPERYDPVTAGYMGFGDQSGAKNSTMRTYLRDAADHGAQILVHTFALKVLTTSSPPIRAAGIAAVHTDPATGETHAVTVRAPQVVVAAGALESPALLLRSEIGGPAVGRHLRLHPCTATMGSYAQPTEAWWGPPHPALIDEFAAGTDGDGYGFLIEGVQYTTGVGAGAIPWSGGEQHKAFLEDFGHVATFIGLIRDHGEGQVVLDDETAMGVPYYALTDPIDVATTRRALEAQIRLHHAAGASRIGVLATGLPLWHRGEDDLEAFIERAQRIPLRAGAMRMFAAHQMGTCRMGTDPTESVANPHGELHDTPGVWIGDASAFPTPSGTNPMITIMALAHRTAERIAAAAADRTEAPVTA
jgi:choline dehydrogenase-like flavoprotein